METNFAKIGGCAGVDFWMDRQHAVLAHGLLSIALSLVLVQSVTVSRLPVALYQF